MKKSKKRFRIFFPVRRKLLTTGKKSKKRT
nr:MAG TPA: hypothetical protein [Caudoviricetes sp.]DAM28150.1 MAG TPA: hypothetical protein [Caudoviricetes sp.]